MAAALDDEAQVVGAGEAYGGGHVGGAGRLDEVGAEGRAPGVEPAGAFGKRGLVGEVEGIAEQRLRLGRGEVRRGDGRQTPADGLLEPGPVGVARPAGLAGADTGGGGRANGSGR